MLGVEALRRLLIRATFLLILTRMLDCLGVGVILGLIDCAVVRLVLICDAVSQVLVSIWLMSRRVNRLILLRLLFGRMIHALLRLHSFCGGARLGRLLRLVQLGEVE